MMVEQRAIVAEFYKDSGGRLKLFSLTTIKRTPEYYERHTYDVEWSRRHGYLFDMSGFGGSDTVTVSGIYFASGEVEIKEKPTAFCHPAAPLRSKETRAIRKRNRTRRLRRLPKAFDLEPGQDLLDWMNCNAIEQPAVYCSECRDYVPGEELCEHSWWCDTRCWYSTPGDRCAHKSEEECFAAYVREQEARP